jgi:hypothetical protein
MSMGTGLEVDRGTSRSALAASIQHRAGANVPQK